MPAHSSQCIGKFPSRPPRDGSAWNGEIAAVGSSTSTDRSLLSAAVVCRSISRFLFAVLYRFEIMLCFCVASPRFILI